MGIKEIIEAAIAFVFIAVGGMAFGWFRILKETNQLLTDQNKELKEDNKEWQKKHSENEKAIAELKGQINMIKDVPLAEIAIHMKQQTQVNQSILTFMQAFNPTQLNVTTNNK